MALSDKKILEEIKNDNIVIVPFKKENLATSSYDVTLGKYYFREKKPNYVLSHYNIYNTKAQVKEIAERKMQDLNASSIEAAIKIIEGSCRSMGVDVK